MRNNSFLTWLIPFLLCCTLTVQAQPRSPVMETILAKPEVKTFIDKMVKEHHFDKAQLTQWFSQITMQPEVLAAIQKPAEALSWERYRSLFLTESRVSEGVTFWKQHAASLKKAETHYGVPAEIIVAILGVETAYGKNIGKYKVLDSLATLGFYYPKRSPFFLSELEHFLLLAREQKWDPTQIKGSYAAAMGFPQFIASSYRKFAVDATGNGKKDLFGNPEDAIGSIANYFKQHGWQARAPIALPAACGTSSPDFVAKSHNPLPQHTLSHLATQGIAPRAQTTLPPTTRFALIALGNEQKPDFWLGGHNFYVITRYNHSSLYAMAVYHLSQKLKIAYEATPRVAHTP